MHSPFGYKALVFPEQGLYTINVRIDLNIFNTPSVIGGLGNKNLYL
jgi:hypothetical protein